MFVLEDTKWKLIFLWTNSIPSIANAMKRAMESEIPKLAIHIVDVQANTSVLPDELIVQRLGLVPLQSKHIDQYLYNNECDCESSVCNSCSVAITLHVTAGPQHTDPNYLDVTSRDLVSSDPNVYPIHDSGIPQHLSNGKESILIARLKQNQTLKFNCIAKKGIHRTHAKFGTTVGVAVRSVPNAKVDADLYTLVKSGKRTQFCKHELQFNAKNGQVSWNGVVCENTLATTTTSSCPKYPLNQSASIFVVESDGSLPPKTIVLRSIDVLKKRLYHLLHEMGTQ